MSDRRNAKKVNNRFVALSTNLLAFQDLFRNGRDHHDLTARAEQAATKLFNQGPSTSQGFADEPLDLSLNGTASSPPAVCALEQVEVLSLQNCCFRF